jgi:hypothetical protein
MIDCIYGMWAMRNDDGDICILCDQCVNYPLNLELPVYEPNLQPKAMNINKGECLGCCEMQTKDPDENGNDITNDMLMRSCLAIRGIPKDVIDSIKGVSDKDIELAIKEGQSYGKR